MVKIKDDAVSGEVVTTKPEPKKRSTSKAVAKTNPTRESALSIVGGVTTEDLKAALEVQTEQRGLIQQFIKDNLTNDIDYGKIHVVKDCQAYKNGTCDKEYHYSKSVLFKPGQEKIFSLFGITDELVKDEDAFMMLGNMPGLVAYKCVMYRGENRIGEGRGAATLGGTNNDPNSTIKKAEKRARMDACLSLGFSAYFTQDLDDPEYKSAREMANERARLNAEDIEKDDLGLLPRDPEAPIDNAERQMLAKEMVNMGITIKDEQVLLLERNGIIDVTNVMSGEARELIRNLRSGLFQVTDKSAVDEPDDNDPASPAAPIVVEPELVIDDDLKQNLSNEIDDMHLNSRGKMWFMKLVCGKPFFWLDKLTETEWRVAYDRVMEIMDGALKIDPAHVTQNARPAQGVMIDVDPEPIRKDLE